MPVRSVDMSGFSIQFDEARGVLLCQIMDSFEEANVPALCNELQAAIRKARSRGPLRFLWDNRANRPLSAEAFASLASVTGKDTHPADRTAILVANSVAKAQSRAKVAAGTGIFASENAAFTWLSVGAGQG